MWRAVAFVFMFFLTSAAQSFERRVAFVVGNANYLRFPALTNPRNDAEDVDKALVRLGFEIFGGYDLTREQTRNSLRQFARAAQGADIAIAYYAGHGLQYKGRNYIVPIDAKLQDEFDLDYETVRVDDVVDELNRSSGPHILILDACRNLPLQQKSARNQFGDLGLAKISGRGLIVAYATQANAVAYDGEGRNSVFTREFLKYVEQPGIDLTELFHKVSVAVDKQTGGRQTPEISLSYPDTFYLNPIETDRDVWRRIRDTGDPEKFRDFISSYPTSDFADAAAAALERIASSRRLAQERAAAMRVAEERAAAMRIAEQERAAAEAKRLADEKAAAEAGRKRLAEERAAAEAKQAAEERAAAAKRVADEKVAAEAKRLADEKVAAEARRKQLAEERAAAEAKRVADERAAVEAKRASEEKAAAKRAAEQERIAADAKRLADERAAAEARRKQLAEERAVAEAKRLAEERAVAAKRAAEQERVAAEAKRVADEKAEAEARRKQLAEERAAAEAKRASEEKAAAVKRVAEEKAAGEARRTQFGERRDATARPDPGRLAALEQPSVPLDPVTRPQRDSGDGKSGPQSPDPSSTAARHLIQAAQTELTRLDCYAGPIDGILNSKTVDAIQGYAKQNELQWSGDIGQNVVDWLRSSKTGSCIGKSFTYKDAKKSVSPSDSESCATLTERARIGDLRNDEYVLLRDACR